MQPSVQSPVVIPTLLEVIHCILVLNHKNMDMKKDSDCKSAVLHVRLRSTNNEPSFIWPRIRATVRRLTHCQANQRRIYRKVSNITHFNRQWNCWSLRCSWSMACRRCSNYIFILNLTPGFIGLGKDNRKTRRETFMSRIGCDWY